MKLTSPSFSNYGAIPSLYSCDGEGLNPPLVISEVPDEAKSLVLIVDDPDAPMGTFNHWIVWNIPPQTTEISEDSIPSGAVEGKNSTGEVGWVAPCPPNGMHHYRFMLSALSKNPDFAEGTDRDTIENEMEDAVIDRAELVGQYTRAVPGTAESTEE